MSAKVVKNLIAEMMGFDNTSEVKKSMTFVEDLGMDDQEIEELLEAIEAEVDMDLVGYSNNFETVGDLIDYIDDNE